MDSSHYRKIELQSPADFTYLHANTVALSRQKLDLHLPPSATQSDEPDPMRERVRELVDDFTTRTFSTASTSVSINGLDSSSPEFPFPAAFTTPQETVEYEVFDGKLAARVSSLYAQLESLTTTVAQLRRDAPGRAAKSYVEKLERVIEEEDQDQDWDGDGEGDYGDDYDDGEGEEEGEGEGEEGKGKGEDMDISRDVEMGDTNGDGAQQEQQQQSETATSTTTTKETRRRRRAPKKAVQWDLGIPLGTEQEAERWRNGEISEVYEDALRSLLRLQGEAVGDDAVSKSDGMDGNALASTVGKAERAARAVEFVEKT
ncbi:kinetochore protein Mis14 like-domain-containing protein [Aspergillus cavernicola]|uniref:Kinetochore protein Mis14 like-domain-containing protein n=1 Tax=Aspergillus cavernicola TaxID=176166 RepID=A0ABR4IGU7_9EURO